LQVESFKIFCDLVETGSFSRAATQNDITQSAVSQQIRALEKRFGVSLIDRGSRLLTLTPEGNVFLEASREILTIYGNLGHRLHELHNIVAGEIKIASIYSIGLHELPLYAKAFRALHPNVELVFDYRRSLEVYALVLSGEVDLGLVSYPVERRGLLIEEFLKDKLVLICHPDHPLADRDSISLTDLEGKRFIGLDPLLPTRKIIDRHFKELGVTVKHEMDFDNVETVKRAVEIASGVSIVPQQTVLQEVEIGSLAAVEIHEPEMWRPLAVVLKRGRPRSPAQKEFIALLKKPLER
jgi:DNA-binding transcriptional LysR family regulator